MTVRQSLEERLDQLGRELGSRPELTAQVMESVALRPQPTSSNQIERRRWSGRRNLMGLLATAAAAVALVVWLSQPTTLYARALAALAKADHVHVEGWTTRVVRKWPLEDPQPADAEDKHTVDAWYWQQEDGTPRSYEKFGPVIQMRDGKSLKEYQEDVELLYIAEGSSNDYTEQFATLARYLQSLERPGMEKQELGRRNEEGCDVRGIRVVHGGRVEEYWFDVDSDLPVRLSRTETLSDETEAGLELRFSYSDPVPRSVANYQPPPTDNIRYGHGHENVQLAWRQHVQEIGLQMQEQPMDQPATIVPRKKRTPFAHQWILQTPDAKYWVVPLELNQHFPLTLENFVKLRVAYTGGDRAYHLWRVPRELHELELRRSDLVYEDGTSWQAWVQFALGEHGLEYVDAVEDRTVWIARHDGRELKPWQEVKPPVPYVVEGGIEKQGIVRPGVGHKLVPVTIHELFADFNMLQNHRLMADHPIIVDQTGLPKPPEWDRSRYPRGQDYRDEVVEDYYVATDSPWFVGPESRQMARQWYEKELGITFEEQKQPMTVHIVRRKE